MDVCGLAHAGTSVDREQMRDRVQSSASSSKIRVAQRSLRSGLGEGQAWRDWTGFPVRASTRATTRACRYPKTSFSMRHVKLKSPHCPNCPNIHRDLERHASHAWCPFVVLGSVPPKAVYHV